uniref:G domain-containing protein n=1 Tax=Panagrolaimus superbus TaxID=310955 RepID=A0A914YTZ5_9BILA
METMNDPMLDEIFSKVHLSPVMYQDPNYKISIEEQHEVRHDITPTSDDENAALQQLDDFLYHQNSTSGSFDGSESHGNEHIDKRSNSTSSTLKSPRISRTSTAVGSAVNEQHESYNPAWTDESYDHFDQARLPGGLPRVQDFGEARNRSRTIDSQASLAESRFGGFDLFDDAGNPNANEINLHHNEVAYPRPTQLPKSPPQEQSKIIPKPNYEGSIVDKQILNDYHRRLAETKVKEQALHEEILRTQSFLLGTELSLRHAAQNARRQLKELEIPSKQHQQKNLPKPLSFPAKANGHNKPKSISPTESELPWKYSFNSIKRQPSVDIYEETVPMSLILGEQLAHAELLEVNSSFRYFIPQHEKISHSKHIEKIIFGGHQNPTNDDKDVLLFGPHGSGKTSFVNTVANYLYDVKKEQDVRFCVNYEKDGTPTKGVRVYVFNNTIYPYRITIVDTPGIPNQKGYTKTSSLIRDWFEMELATSNTLRIDAISIVLRHDEDELGWPLINELAAVKRLLKDDLRTNVMPITTFGEVLPQPQALRSIVFANIPFVSYYKVNNAGYMQRPQTEKALTHNMCYKHTVAELERYFTDLHELMTPLLAVRNQQ